MTPTILVKKLPNYAGPDEPLKPAHPGDAGMDLYAAEDITIYADSRAAVATGLSVALPPGFEFQIRAKSGLALKEGLMVANGPGTVDSSYRGEIKVILYNSNAWVRTSDFQGLWEAASQGKPYPKDKIFFSEDSVANAIEIKRGQKIAQAVIARYETPLIQVLDEGEELPESERGTEGFGSTGS